MKLSKNLGRIATTFLATAMLAGLTAVPASAAAISNGTAGAGDENPLSDNKLSFNSVLMLPEDVNVPEVTYTYTLEGIAPDTDETIENGKDTGKAVKVKPGTDTITTDSKNVTVEAEFLNTDTPDDTSYDGIKQKIHVVDINLLNDFSFSEVGVYKYKLTQTCDKSSDSNFIPTTKATRWVYLYVARVDDSPATYAVTGAVMCADESKDSKSDGNFNNFYLISGDPDNPGQNPVILTNNLTVKNTITGVMGDMTDTFTYKIKVDNTNTKNYKYVVNDDKGTPVETGTLINNSEVTLNKSLGNDYTITIYGLDKDDTYTITRVTENDNRGYTVTNTSGAGATNVASGKLERDETADNGALKPATVTFENNRTTIAPTGLVMNVAPYVLLVLVAAGAGYVFLRKRDED